MINSYKYDFIRNMNMPSLYSPEEGFNKGNMFSNLYEQYKNYKPKELVGNNDMEKMFLELARICFAKHDIQLYLDLHPDDVSMIQLFNDYRERENNLLKMYEAKYGVINTDSESLNQTPFVWATEKFPWEVNRYV